MKKHLLICLLSVVTMGASAQNAALTKDETISYINKKVVEATDHAIQFTNMSLTIIDASFSKASKEGYITLTYKRIGDSQWQDDYRTVVFNPAHIVNIVAEGDEVRTTSPVSNVVLKLVGKTASYTRRVRNHGAYYWQSPTEESLSSINVPFLQSDPTNFGKLKKALEYLKTLCKAEDDPFAN
ncbi:hypothetical protein ACFGVR_12780 [Mucilaginibacter sp. AW1-3]